MQVGVEGVVTVVPILVEWGVRDTVTQESGHLLLLLFTKEIWLHAQFDTPPSFCFIYYIQPVIYKAPIVNVFCL